MSSIHLHIDRIVVRGMARADGRRFAIALEEKLRQWAGNGLAGVVPGDQHRAISSLNVGSLRPGSTPAQAAMQVVQAIQARLSPRSATTFNASNGRRHV